MPSLKKKSDFRELGVTHFFLAHLFGKKDYFKRILSYNQQRQLLKIIGYYYKFFDTSKNRMVSKKLNSSENKMKGIIKIGLLINFDPQSLECKRVINRNVNNSP